MIRAYLYSIVLTILCSTTLLFGMELVDVQTVIDQASAKANTLGVPRAVIAVVDREGYVLGVWDSSSDTDPDTSIVNAAISKAGTAAFLSSNHHAFTSRTGGFLIQDHFPPGVRNRPPGPLVGLGLSSLPFSDVNHYKIIGTDAPIAGTSIVGNPGGVPLYKDGELLGGIGVSFTGDLSLQQSSVQVSSDEELVALAGQIGFAPDDAIKATNVAIDGISLPYVESKAEAGSAASTGIAVTAYPLSASPAAIVYDTLDGFEGEIRSPIIADPKVGLIQGEARLTEDEVRTLIVSCIQRAQTTRAGIRSPRGSTARMYISVLSNPDAEGEAPAVLGTFRMPDTTMFSWDISVQKGRTVLFFSDNTRAFSARTINFLSQNFYPPGIDGTTEGPFAGLQNKYSDADNINPNLPNGMTIFPGAFPLYRNGVMIGAISVSGDGVDQDDYVASAGAELFPAPLRIIADRKKIRGLRLPYAKYPRNPEEL